MNAMSICLIIIFCLSSNSFSNPQHQLGGSHRFRDRSGGVGRVRNSGVGRVVGPLVDTIHEVGGVVSIQDEDTININNFRLVF